MNFFDSQDAARKKTGLLVVYFLAAVLAIILAVYLTFAGIFVYGEHKAQSGTEASGFTELQAFDRLWDPNLFLLVAGGTTILVLMGSLYKIAVLRSGGATIARMLGGRPVNPNTRDLNERMLLNVVEEMAIASGTPVPPVYLMPDEEGINAFAAGFSPNDAVIGVTRGAVELLSRDELQGVIAHEFSHILNGDMRLNIRLMGVLHGILLIGVIGYWVMRSSWGSSSRSRSGKKGGGGYLAILGLALMVIGYIGVFFGKLIKSAVSRQREYLADASAVQFTRNPEGIAGALKKIGGLGRGSRVGSPKAEEASHLFFGNAMASTFLGWMATHPPLDTRIQRIDPQFDGKYPQAVPQRRTMSDYGSRGVEAGSSKQAEAIRARARGKKQAGVSAAVLGFQPLQAVAQIGAPDGTHLAYAAALMSEIPEKVIDDLHEPLGAVAAIYCLLLDDSESIRSQQRKLLAEQTDRRACQELERILPNIDELGAEARLPLVEMAIPALQQLSAKQYGEFRETVRRLVAADQKISLFEYALQRMLLGHLSATFEGTRRPRVIQYYSLRGILPTCAQLLSAIAHVGNEDREAAQRAFTAGLLAMQVPDGELHLVAREQCDLRVVDAALDRLRLASPQIKKRLLEACAVAIGSDRQVTVEEGELLRVIADSLDCPMPPLAAQA